MAKKRLSTRTIDKLDGIEIAFQEPRENVLRGLAEMGYSRRAAAAALGWSHRRGAGALRRIDPEAAIAWPGPNQSRCRRCTPRRSPREALRRYYRDGPGRERLGAVEVGGRPVPRAELLAQFGHPDLRPDTFRWRLARGWPLQRALRTPPQRRRP